MWTVDSFSLKSSKLVADMMVSGRRFNRGIISGKKLCFY